MRYCNFLVIIVIKKKVVITIVFGKIKAYRIKINDFRNLSIKIHRIILYLKHSKPIIFLEKSWADFQGPTDPFGLVAKQ